MARNLSFENIHLSHGACPVLRDINFQAAPGEITVLMGPSGAGKTSCLRLVAGFEKPRIGRICWGSEPLGAGVSGRSAGRPRIGFCFQDDALWPAVRVADHLAIPLRTGGLPREDIDRRVREWLERFGLASLGDRLPGQLSGGEQKRLALARALAVEPPLLLLDEPLSSVEGPLRETLLHLILSCRSAERVILVVTHQIEEALALADQLVLLSQGRLLRRGSAEEVFRRPESLEAARLMGYRTFLPLTPDPEACVPVREAGKRLNVWEGTAATRADDWQALSGEGEGVVLSCRYRGGGHEVLARFGQHAVSASTETRMEPGTRMSLRLLRTPAWLPIAVLDEDRSEEGMETHD